MSVAVIFTSGILGGHEIMAVRLCRYWMGQGLDVRIYVPQRNVDLMCYLGGQGLAFKTHSVNDVFLGSMQAILNPVLLGKGVHTIRRIKRGTNFSNLIVVQGDIEFGAVFLVAARLLGVDAVSYLPYAHTFRKMGARLGWFRDIFAFVIYRCCKSYITISPYFANQLNARNPRSHVEIMENFLSSGRRRKCRGNGRPSGPIRIFQVGRVYFRQKGQDLLIDAVRGLKSVVGGFELHFVGSGPDIETLRQLTATLPEGVKPVIHGWCEEWWSLGKGPDVLVIPSRFEGVPLVMLEAIREQIPVIAPKRDGMADYLPLEHLYPACQSRNQEVEQLRLKLQEVISSPHNFLKG